MRDDCNLHKNIELKAVSDEFCGKIRIACPNSHSIKPHVEEVWSFVGETDIYIMATVTIQLESHCGDNCSPFVVSVFFGDDCCKKDLTFINQHETKSITVKDLRRVIAKCPPSQSKDRGICKAKYHIKANYLI
ncbi:S-Ena type endospore appendage [Lederbergia lenta]|uniref:Endospore appendages core domain-containing protein n=1 Tax=Lederbergia lenta TaxID=1467 RepID=A0A2X4WBI8_LEDLE|nr:S-Ena type endospore appendage [Lederbergia lenta]MCM3113489.1 hypothetical protein [Lederbergia lenta]MEC2326729.1 hypothetical protein [Lederbergia lenta]SQI61526.1 Uncharacterised protein [Lederbergia lenta]